MTGDTWTVFRDEQIVGTVTETERGFIARDLSGHSFPARDFFTVAAQFDLDGDDWS